LDHFVILSQAHFDHLVRVWLEHYHTERPHQAKGNESPARPSKLKPTKKADSQATRSSIECRERLGGLLKHCYHKAA